MRQVKAYFFGDSIFFGQYVSPHHVWVTRIAAGMEAYFRDAHSVNLLVQNPSVNGSTTDGALERMSYHVEAHKPEFVIVQFGMNDCNYWATDKGAPRVPPEKFKANLHEIIRRARAIGAQVMLQTNHPSGRTADIFPHTHTTYEQSNQRYNGFIRETAKEANVPLCDVEKAAADYCAAKNIAPRALVMDDLLHLSLEGHQFYAGLCEPFIRRFIEEGINADRHARTA